MAVSDPISDMLTRIRNGIMAGKDEVSMPSSKIKKAIADLLVSEGYLREVTIAGDKEKPQLVVKIKYVGYRDAVIEGLKRVSRPGRRVYVGAEHLPLVRRGLGISVISTSKGIMSSEKARAEHVGGEVICEVW